MLMNLVPDFFGTHNPRIASTKLAQIGSAVNRTIDSKGEEFGGAGRDRTDA
jgi:hypothetical protein